MTGDEREITCIDCGGRVKHSQVRDDFVFVCRGCGRIYWPSDVLRMIRASVEGDR